MSGPRLVAPRSVEDAGLSGEFVTQLALKTLYFAGDLTGSDWARRLGVPFGVIESSLEFLRHQSHCEVVGAAFVGGSSFRYRITDEGRRLASQYLAIDHYVGAMPVPLAQYRAYMTSQAVAPPRVTRDDLRAAVAGLVVGDDVIDQIGPAVSAGRSLFIYGPPGNGKSAIAHALHDLFGGDIAIPRAIEVEGRVIRVFDPLTHEERPTEAAVGLELDLDTDHRWAICRRPFVTAGGEMTLEMLELAYNDRLGYYRAPLQLVANGGILLIDDFGRQRCAPRDLLNRWMVPLEDRVDYLTLHSGLKFEVPFHVFLAFATNLTPSQLVDEAFLRRVPYKVFAANPTREEFTLIFERHCRARAVPYDEGLVRHLLDGYFRRHGVVPRGCHPRDLINQALLLAEYRGAPPRLTAELLDATCNSYFVHDEA